MSWVKRNLYFLIGGIIALVMLGGAGWYLYSKWDLNNVALAHFAVFQHIDRLQVGHAASLQDLDRTAGETALRKLGGALHEQHDVVVLHEIIDALLDVGHGSGKQEKAHAAPISRL